MEKNGREYSSDYQEAPSHGGVIDEDEMEKLSRIGREIESLVDPRDLFQ